MKMKRKRPTVGIETGVVSLVLLTLLSSPLYAQVDAMSQARTVATFGLMSPRLMNALNLTPEQAAKIEAGKNAFREAQRAYLREIAPLRREVADKLFGPNPTTEADVARPIAKIAELREKILREGFRIALEVRSVLTPEQLTKAAAIRQQLQQIQSELRELYNESP